MLKNRKKLIFILSCLIVTSISLTGCITISISSSNKPPKEEKTKEDVKYSQVYDALENKYIKGLKIGEKSEFKPSMIVMRNLKEYYFLIPYTFNEPDIYNDENDKYAKSSHEGWLEIGENFFGSYTYDIIRDNNAKEASVVITHIDEERYLIRMILPTNYPINTSKDSKTVSSGKTSTTYYYENAVVYSKQC